MKSKGRHGAENKKEYQPTWFKSEFGMLGYCMRIAYNLHLKPKQSDVFAYIVEQVNSHHTKSKAYLTGVPITHKEFMEVIGTKSKTHISAILKKLESLSLITIEVGSGKNPSKYKIVDNNLLPLHLRKDRSV